MARFPNPRMAKNFTTKDVLYFKLNVHNEKGVFKREIWMIELLSQLSLSVTQIFHYTSHWPYILIKGLGWCLLVGNGKADSSCNVHISMSSVEIGILITSITPHVNLLQLFPNKRNKIKLYRKGIEHNLCDSWQLV